MHQEIWFQKYKILRLLGRGGTAKVYLAEHIKLNSYRAIKVISKNHPLYDLQRNEAFILKNLKHSGIPIIYDIEEDEEGSYIVEQYLEGETLKGYVESRGAIREDILIQFGKQLCNLIHYLHSVPRPIIYVDLKPENIILSGMTLKLIDFGSALYQDELTVHQSYSGTKGYAAPELYCQGKIDERCDVYGIGMLLYYMAAGILLSGEPGEIENIDRTGNCSKQLKYIINKCLRYHPSQRYTDVSSLYRKLSAVGHRNQFKAQTRRTVSIAVAGTQHRIGVTHFAFRICKYYSGQKKSCLYQELNDSGCIWSIKNCFEDVTGKEGIYIIEGIPMAAYQTGLVPDVHGFEVIIRDFGCLTKENLADFLSADIRFLILGAKDWELDCSESVLNMVTEYKDIFYLFNFINGRQFQQVVNNMDNRNCYRIPYEPDPFTDIITRNEQELFEELFPLNLRESFRKRAAGLLRKGESRNEA